jgi:hypothetical protein
LRLLKTQCPKGSAASDQRTLTLRVEFSTVNVPPR